MTVNARDMSQLREFNRRVVLRLLIEQGPKSKAQIARETGLSGQGASIIVNSLLDDGLLLKQDKVRGQIGQPSTPVAPNPNGAYSLGIHLGRRDIDAVLVNLSGAIVHSETKPILLSSPDESLAVGIRLAKSCLDKLAPAEQSRIVGLGVAMPHSLDLWSEELAIEPQVLSGWRDMDVADALSTVFRYPVTVYNDAEAACGAELICSSSINSRSAIYVYLGAFVGGSVVIDGRIHRGEKLKAGAIGSIPASRTRGSRRSDQLIRWVSIAQLESMLDQFGLNGRLAVRRGGVEEADPHFENWANDAAFELARAIISAMAIIDCETIVVDGVLNSDWKVQFAQKIRRALDEYDYSGLTPAVITIGSLGHMARVMGAALTPLREWIALDNDTSSSSVIVETKKMA